MRSVLQTFCREKLRTHSSSCVEYGTPLRLVSLVLVSIIGCPLRHLCMRPCLRRRVSGAVDGLGTCSVVEELLATGGQARPSASLRDATLLGPLLPHAMQLCRQRAERLLWDGQLEAAFLEAVDTSGGLELCTPTQARCLAAVALYSPPRPRARPALAVLRPCPARRCAAGALPHGHACGAQHSTDKVTPADAPE